MKIGVFKFSSCDGCQLAFFDIADKLLENSHINIKYFLEAQSENQYESFDVSFVEGSVSTQEEIERIVDIRKKSKYVVAIGACAVSGGIQSIRNFLDFNLVSHEDILKESRPLSDYIMVDYYVRGCPINGLEVIEIVSSILLNKTPNINKNSVCLECKAKGNVCLFVLGNPCLGPITASGCGAICPSFKRGCYGCFGPLENANIDSMKALFKDNGWDFDEFILSSFNAYHPYYRGISLR